MLLTGNHSVLLASNHRKLQLEPRIAGGLSAPADGRARQSDGQPPVHPHGGAPLVVVHIDPVGELVDEGQPAPAVTAPVGG
jgi:hypothetical protein